MNGGWRLRRFATFDALRTAWPEVDCATGGSLFSTAAWFETLAAAGFDPDPEQVWALFEHPPTGAAFCLPLAKGRALLSLSNYYSSLYESIGVPPEGASAALAELFRLPELAAPLVRLHPLDPEGRLFDELERALADGGYWTDRFFCFGNWYLDVAGRRFEQYFDERPAQLRNTVRRGRAKLDREGNWQIAIHTGGDELDRAVDAFESVYARSWKHAEPYPHFIRRLCHAAAARGWLRLGVLTLAGEPIAAQLWFARCDTAYIYKLAYDERHRRFSAGSVLTAELMRRVIDGDRVSVVDYLTGDEPYKRDWMSHRRERMGLVAFRPSAPSGLLAAARHFSGKLIKKLRYGRTTPPCAPPPSSPT